MIAALIIVLREVFEAGLIVGIVMAATRGVRGRSWWVAGGVLGGILGVCVVALFAARLFATFGGAGQEFFNAGILSVAVLMLIWHNVWMARHGRQLAAEMRSAGEAAAAGSASLAALAVVVAVAVLREGAEVALFLYGVAISSGAASTGMMIGGFAGLMLGVLVCLLTYLGLVSIPSRHLFAVTSVMLAFLAAAMAAQAIALLEQANVVTTLQSVVWDTSRILPDNGLFGRALHTLIGYSDHPTVMQLVIYSGTLMVIFALTRRFAAPATVRR